MSLHQSEKMYSIRLQTVWDVTPCGLVNNYVENLTFSKDLGYMCYTQHRITYKAVFP
jgi:hypothetical protein